MYFYYRLTNFYQNHRRYVKSLDTSQLQGTAVPAKTIGTGTCDPLKLDANGKPYYPCGLIANSVFNDTFAEPVLLNVPRDEGGGDNRTYAMTDKGISWSTDAALYGPTQYNFDQIAVPPNWAKRWPNGYSQEDPPPNLKEDEAFQVWMRTAGLPAFSKLARRNDNQTMVTGRYQLDIQMSTYIRSTVHCYVLTLTRFPGDGIRRYEIYCPLNSHSYGRKESISWYRLYRRCRNLCCSGCHLHNNAFN